MPKYLNDVSPEILEKSFNDRKYSIDWFNLNTFSYDRKNKPIALTGKVFRKRLYCTVSVNTNAGSPQRPMAVFYKLKKNKTREVQEAYFLNDEECDKFESMCGLKTKS